MSNSIYFEEISGNRFLLSEKNIDNFSGFIGSFLTDLGVKIELRRKEVKLTLINAFSDTLSRDIHPKSILVFLGKYLNSDFKAFYHAFVDNKITDDEVVDICFLFDIQHKDYKDFELYPIVKLFKVFLRLRDQDKCYEGEYTFESIIEWYKERFFSFPLFKIAALKLEYYLTKLHRGDFEDLSDKILKVTETFPYKNEVAKMLVNYSNWHPAVTEKIADILHKMVQKFNIEIDSNGMVLHTFIHLYKRGITGKNDQFFAEAAILDGNSPKIINDYHDSDEYMNDKQLLIDRYEPDSLEYFIKNNDLNELSTDLSLQMRNEFVYCKDMDVVRSIYKFLYHVSLFSFSLFYSAYKFYELLKTGNEEEEEYNIFHILANLKNFRINGRQNVKDYNEIVLRSVATNYYIILDPLSKDLIKIDNYNYMFRCLDSKFDDIEFIRELLKSVIRRDIIEILIHIIERVKPVVEDIDFFTELFIVAIEHFSIQSFKYLFGLNFIKYDKDKVLIDLLKNNNLELIKYCVENKFFDVNESIEGILDSVQNKSRTYAYKINSLYFPVKKNYIDIVEYLLSKNADVDIKAVVDDKDAQCKTIEPLLMMAITNNSYKVAKLLLQHGADVNCRRTREEYDGNVLVLCHIFRKGVFTLD